MPNYVKYSTSIPSGSLLKGTVALGINDNVIGPTSTTGWYTGINLASGSYIIYEVAASGDPDIYCPQNDTELFNLVRSKGATGGNTGSVAAALAWIGTQTNLLAVNEVYPNIVTSGSVMNLDGGFVGSYPTTGSIWYDVSGNNNSGSLINNPTYNPIGGITFDGVDDYVTIPGDATNNFQPTNSFTINAIFKPIGIGSPTAVVDNTSVVLGTGVAAGSYGIGLNYNQIAGTYNLRIGCRSTDNIFLTTEYPITLNTIYDVSLTYQTNGVQYIYVNGVQINSQSTVAFSSKSLTPSTTYGFNIFRNYPVYGGNPRYGIGSFYKGLIYNRALSQSEILQNYYQAPIVTNGLVFAVDAGNLVSYESGSTTTYSLTGSISGSLINGTGFTNINGGAWNFDGVDDYVPCTGSFTVTSATFVTWIRRDGNQVSYAGILFSRGTNTTGMDFTTSNQLGYHWNDAAATYNWASGLTIPNLTWCMVAISVTSTSATGYLCQTSGITTATNTTNHASSVLNAINIARDSGIATRVFKGNIAISQLYNRALSADEITQNFNAQKGRFGL